MQHGGVNARKEIERESMNEMDGLTGVWTSQIVMEMGKEQTSTPARFFFAVTPV